MSIAATSASVGDLEGPEAVGVVPRSVAERMDRLSVTWLHLAVFVVGSLGFAFDLVEVSLGNVLSAVFSAPPYSVQATELSWLLSAMFIGAIPGALGAGWVADRYGRRTAMIAVLLILFVTSIAAAASPDIGSLIVFRTLSGVALGAYPPLLFSLLTDLLPPRRRGTMIMMTAGIASFGPVLMIFLVRSLTPVQPLGIEAWRWAFIAGAVGALVVAVIFRFIPESPRWLAARGRHAEAEQALARFERSRVVIRTKVEPVSETKPEGDAARNARPNWWHFAVVAAIFFASPWGTVAFPLLMGAVLIEKGFALSESLLYVGVAMVGPAVGTLIASLFVDKLERRVALLLLGLGMIASAVLFAASIEPIWLMVASVAFQLLAIMQVSTMNIYAAELFPTAWRGRTSTAAWSINRVASALAPLVLLPLLTLQGVWSMFAVVVAMLGVGVAILIVAPKGRGGRAIE